MSDKNYSDSKKIEAIQNLTLMNDDFMTIMLDENYSLVEYILKTVLQKDLKVINKYAKTLADLIEEELN